MVPVYIWTVREFDGTDPWDNDRPTRWSVAGYKLVHPRFVKTAMSIPPPRVDPASETAVPRKFQLGVVARATGRYRIFPGALQDLWRAGRVRDEALPWLLHRVEGRLHRHDYPVSMLMLLSLVLGLLMAVYALGGFAGWYLLTPHTNHPTQPISAALWLSRPMQGEQGLEIRGKFPALDKPVVIASLSAPSGMHGRQSQELFVVQAAHEKRLVLASRGYDLVDPDGTMIRTTATGIPAEVLRKLQDRYPDLNAGDTLCTGWEWDDAVSPYRAGEWEWMKGFAIWCGPLAAFLLTLRGIYWWRRRSQRKLWARLLQSQPTAVNV